MTEKEFESLLRATAKKMRTGEEVPRLEAAKLLVEAADRLEAFAAVGAALMRK